MYGSIVIKLIIGMLGVLLFLRMTGKTQMANLTPLDTVNTIVLGALVGSIIYMPEAHVWILAFSMLVWFILNLLIRLLLRLDFFSKLIHGESEFIIRDDKINMEIMKKNNLSMDQFRAKLRESDIFSLHEVEEVVFETDGEFTIIKKKNGSESYLLINDGKIVEEELEETGHDKEWLVKNLKELGYDKIEEIFCAEYTTKRGFYIVDMEGNIMKKNKKGEVHKIDEVDLDKDDDIKTNE
ncbi:MAG: DUF421 domain-containing protein [Bacteroidales bacterium]|nr:DUF421 domain-containing protein [Bacteroidales bacterium]